MLRLLLCLLTLTILWQPAMAEDEAATPVAEETTEKAAQDAVPEMTEVVPSKQAKEDSEALHKAIDDLLEDLPEINQKHFMTLYHTHNIVSVVKTVRHDIGKAVEACGENNPDLADKMTTRFTQWKDKTASILVEAEGNINNMIIAQDYAQPQEITAILNLANEVRAKGEASLNKVPVSTKAACEKLYTTMKKTQKDVINMMRETLISVPHAMQQEQAKAQDSTAAEESE